MKTRIGFPLMQGLYYPAALGAAFAAVVIQASTLPLSTVLSEPRSVLSLLAIWYFSLSYLVTLFRSAEYDWADFLSDFVECFSILAAFSYLGWFSQPDHYSVRYGHAFIALAVTPVLHLVWNLRRLVRGRPLNPTPPILNVLRLTTLVLGAVYSHVQATPWLVAIALAVLNTWFNVYKARLQELGEPKRSTIAA